MTCSSEELANVSQVRTNVNIQTTPVECEENGGRLTCHARLNRSPSGAPHQSFSIIIIHLLSELINYRTIKGAIPQGLQ